MFACEYFLSALALEIDYSRSYTRIFKVKAGEKLSTPTYHDLFDLLLRDGATIKNSNFRNQPYKNNGSG
jgi:hypothetical protein